jgi:hypothetical protein
MILPDFQILDVRTAAQLLGLSEGVIRWHIFKGHLQVSKLAGRSVFSKSAYDRFMDRRVNGGFGKVGRPRKDRS